MIAPLLLFFSSCPQDSPSSSQPAHGARIYFTYDGGNSWEPDTTDLADALINSSSIADQVITAVGKKNGVTAMIHLGLDDEWHADNVGSTQYLNKIATNLPRYSGNIGPVGFAIGSALLRTTDRGGSWREISLPSHGSMSSIDFAGSGLLGMIAADNAIFRTTDAGLTWTKTPATLVTQIASINDSTWVAAGGGLLRSTDRGLTWNSATVPVPVLDEFKNIGASPDGHVIAISTEKILNSSDGGLTWTDRTPGAVGDKHEYSALYYGHGVAYVAVYNTNQTRPILKSLDNGETWTSVGNRITDGHVYGLYFFDGIVGHAVGD
jgi:photosystem II stability/assembly factor-like uncharacterized protein